MKYFGEIGTLELEPIPKFPDKFPVFIIMSEEEKRKYNSLMVAAAQRGFSMSKRKVCFTLGCKEGYTHEEIFNEVKKLPEISKEEYTLLKQIPHWNPMEHAVTVLVSYLEMIKEAKIALDENPELTEIFKASFVKGEQQNNVRIVQD